MAYNITSTDQLIDVATINKGCDMIDEAAKDFNTSGVLLSEAADTCDAKALSVDDTSMQPTIDELAESVKKIQTQVNQFTTEIRTIANQIYNEQSTELREYQEEQIAKQKEQEENNK